MLSVLEVDGCDKVKMPTGKGSKLKSVGLKDNKDVPLELLENIEIVRMNLSKSNVDDRMMAHLHANLKQINLSYCGNVTDAGVKHLARCKDLKIVDLSFCKKLTDTSLKTLALECAQLEVVTLNENVKLTDDGICHLVQGSGLHLKVLKVGRCHRVTDLSLLEIAANCPQMKHLDVSATKSTNRGVSKLLQEAVRLEVLSISGCAEVTDKPIAMLTMGLAPNLTRLEIVHCTQISTNALFQLKQTRKDVEVIRNYA